MVNAPRIACGRAKLALNRAPDEQGTTVLPATSLKTRIKGFETWFRDTYGTDVSTPDARRRAWWDFQLMDHAFFRVWWTNFAELAPGAFRSNQPSPDRIRAYAAQGIKTMINLRGVGRHSHYLFEQQACAESGITLISHRLYASQLAPRDELLALYQTFRTAEKPFVIHCKSGADRAGLASALYLMMICGTPVAQAKQQLSWRFLHFSNSTTGILDYMLDQYQLAFDRDGISILDWITNIYDPAALTTAFRALKG